MFGSTYTPNQMFKSEDENLRTKLIKAAYESMLAKNESPKVANAGDIYTQAKAGWDSGQSTIGKIGKSALGGIAGLLGYLNTAEGTKLLGGMQKNPYMGMGMIGEADKKQAREDAMRKLSADNEGERQKNLIGYASKLEDKGIDMDIAKQKMEYDKQNEVISKVREGLTAAFKSGQLGYSEYMKAMEDPMNANLVLQPSFWEQLIGSIGVGGLFGGKAKLISQKSSTGKTNSGAKYSIKSK